ncbi:FecR domain-containing protein [Lachnospiraceae bacterium 56-18]
MKKKLFRGNLFLLLILVMLLSASCGRNRATTMKLIKTDGEVGVENEKGKSVDLIENLGLYNGYGIGTQKKSFAWIDLDDTKLTKMDEKSDVGIKKDGKKLELVVNSGGLFFNVTKPLEDDESMDIRTSTTICGIRGTCGWVEAHGDTTYVGLFDGKVECTVTADGKEETVRVNAKEILIVKKDGDHVTYEVKKLTYKDVPEFVQVEIADEPFALEDETHTVDDFLGVYSSTENEYGDVSEAELGLDDEGALYFRQGNGIYQSYSSYEVDGNIITATYQDVTGTYTDTFTLNEDGSLTTEFGDEDLRHLNMTFAFEREISEQEEQAEASDEINRFLGTYTKDLGSYKEALILTVREDGLLYWNAGNSYHGGWMGDRYTEYSINGNELKATNEGGTDTFILDANGSITATFSALDFYNGVYERNDGYDETEEYPGGYP